MDLGAKEVNDTRVKEQEKQDKKTYENQKKIKQIFKDNQKNPFLFNDVNTALDWKHSNPLVVTVKSSNQLKKIKNFVLNAGEHECCFHFIKNDIVTRCKLTNKLVGIDMDFYRSCNPDGQTAKLIDYYHLAGNIPREFMFRRQYFCWTHLSLLTGVRPKIVHSEIPDGNLETKLFAVSMIPADTVFACFCNYRASRKFVRTVFQKEPSGGDDTMPRDTMPKDITEMPYTVGKNDSFYFNLFFRDIADYAVADDQDSETKVDEKGNNIYNAVLDKYKLVIEKDDQNTNEIQYIKVDEKDKTAQDDFIDDIWALKAKYDIYGGHGEENHVEIKYHASKIEIENIKLQYYGNNIASNKKGKPQPNSDINVDELQDNVKIKNMKSYSNTRDTGNDEEKEVIDNDENSKNNKCPFVFLLFCKNTKKVLKNAYIDYEKGTDITKDDIKNFLKELNSLKEPNLEIIFFLQKEGVPGKDIYFLLSLFKKYNYESILNTVTPDEYRSLKQNFLNVYPEHNYQFNYIRNKQYETCGSIIKYFRLAQNYYTPEQVTNTLKSFFTFYKEAVSTKINHKVEGFDKKQYNENIDMITHVAFSEMPYFKNLREELNIVQLASSADESPPSSSSSSSPPPPSSSLPATTTTTSAATVTGGEDLSNVSCLTHGTSLDFFSKILDNNYLVPNPGDPVKNVLGYDETVNKGAFFSLILKCNESKTINPLCANDVILVFSKNILNKYPYHISNEWVGGIQLEPLIPGKKRGSSGYAFKTYNKITDYYSDNEKYICSYGSDINNIGTKNEVIFDDNISLEDLIEIWICDMQNMTQRINTKKEDGTYTRKTVNIVFDPQVIKQNVENLLTSKGLNIPVKIIRNIPKMT